MNGFHIPRSPSRCKVLFRDISDSSKELDASQQLVADSYSDFTEGHQTIQSVRQALATANAANRFDARTFNLYGPRPGSHHTELLGTIRTCVPKLDCFIDRMECFELMQFYAGWRKFDFDKFDPSDVIEFSRLAVSRSIRSGISRQLKFQQVVVQSLFKRAYLATVAGSGCTAAWAIIPAKIRHILSKSPDFRCDTAPNVELNHVRYQSFFEQFSGYWFKQDPKLCRIEFSDLANDPLLRFWREKNSTESESCQPSSASQAVGFHAELAASLQVEL